MVLWVCSRLTNRDVWRPVVMNPTLFVPFVIAPVVNAVCLSGGGAGLIDKAIAFAWTTPALIGAAWGAGWAFKASILTAVLMVLMLIYLPFFRVYEKRFGQESVEPVSILVRGLIHDHHRFMMKAAPGAAVWKIVMNFEHIVMDLIVRAGEAKSLAFEALARRGGDFAKAESCWPTLVPLGMAQRW